MEDKYLDWLVIVILFLFMGGFWINYIVTPEGITTTKCYDRKDNEIKGVECLENPKEEALGTALGISVLCGIVIVFWLMTLETLNWR